MTNEALREPPQQRIRPGHIAGGASHIETQTNRQFGDLLHTLGEDSEDLPALVHGEPDDQHPPLGAREKLSEHDAGITAVADQIGPLVTSSSTADPANDGRSAAIASSISAACSAASPADSSEQSSVAAPSLIPGIMCRIVKVEELASR